MSARWFRFYDEALDDPKVQTLPPELFKAWVNLLCIASKNDGILPAVDKISFSLRIDERGVERLLERLLNEGLIDRRNGGVNGYHYAPHGWDQRQYKSDTSTDRVKRYRQRKRETAPETDTDTEKKEEANASSKKAVSKSVKGHRIPDDWEPPEGHPKVQAITATWPNGKLDTETERFRDHWRSSSGANARKTDWTLAYLNWLRSADERLPQSLRQVPPNLFTARPDRQRSPAELEAARQRLAARGEPVP
ncbi:hypothetical protein [Sphingopyxis sp. NJF-3]